MASVVAVAAVAAALVLALIAPAPAMAKGCVAQTAGPGQVPSSKAEQSVLCLLNRQRAKRGLEKLERHRQLDKPSQAHSELMVRDKCFEHVCPGEDDLGDRLVDYLAQGGRSYGENIAYGTGEFGSPRSIVKGWMGSEGHRRNILDPNFEHIGIGVVWGSPVSGMGGLPAGTYTTDFGQRQG